MVDHFDALTPLYDRLISPPNPARLRALLDLRTTGWVLDAGGGTGRIAAQLRPLAGHLVLLDRSQPMLR
jgi:ubiquinone/menaquinone biosynthesis C-methylase UbiE